MPYQVFNVIKTIGVSSHIRGRGGQQKVEPTKEEIERSLTHCPGCDSEYAIEDGKRCCTDPNCDYWAY